MSRKIYTPCEANDDRGGYSFCAFDKETKRGGPVGYCASQDHRHASEEEASDCFRKFVEVEMHGKFDPASPFVYDDLGAPGSVLVIEKEEA